MLRFAPRHALWQRPTLQHFGWPPAGLGQGFRLDRLLGPGRIHCLGPTHTVSQVQPQLSLVGVRVGTDSLWLSWVVNMQEEHTEDGMFDTTVKNFEILKTMLKLALNSVSTAFPWSACQTIQVKTILSNYFLTYENVINYMFCMKSDEIQCFSWLRLPGA